MNDVNRILPGVKPEYRVRITPSFYYWDLYYNGYLIEDIEIDGDWVINFDVEIEKESWGLGGINVHNIQSNKLATTLRLITYDGNDDEKEIYVEVPINWDGAKIEYDNGRGSVSIDDVEFTLDVVRGHSDSWTNKLLGLDRLVVKEILIKVNGF